MIEDYSFINNSYSSSLVLAEIKSSVKFMDSYWALLKDPYSKCISLIALSKSYLS